VEEPDVLELVVGDLGGELAARLSGAVDKGPGAGWPDLSPTAAPA
jgi:hypothetical protein